MKKLFICSVSIVLLFQCGLIYGTEYSHSLVFKLRAEITTDSLFYKITKIILPNDDIIIDYNSKIKTFDPVDIDLEVLSNINTDSVNNYQYALSLVHGRSSCINYNDVIEKYKHPIISTIIDGNKEILSRNPSTPISFHHKYSIDKGEYLSDKRKLHIEFHEPQPNKIIKDFKVCEGDFTVLSGLAL
ncbi:hypothetical protein ACRTC3_12970 [Photobacterium damselae]|uniref:hypothetical protein n=1 Tax=Photobacterium damselae TaxID=38293 RepID=UPI003D7DADF4